MRTPRNESALPARRPLHSEGAASPAHPLGLWAASASTANLLGAMSRRLGLDWQLNSSARPELLALTNLGEADPARLAARCRPRRLALCLDDKAGRDFVKQSKFPCFTYSESRPEADLTAHDLRSAPDGLTFLAVTKSELARVTVPENALYDALAALACAAALQIPLTSAARAVSDLLCSEPGSLTSIPQIP